LDTVDHGLPGSSGRPGGPKPINTWQHGSSDTGDASTVNLEDGKQALALGDYTPGKGYNIITDVHDPETDTHSMRNEVYDVQYTSKNDSDMPQADLQALYNEAYQRALQKAMLNKPIAINHTDFSYNDVQYAMNMKKYGETGAQNVQQNRPDVNAKAQEYLAQVKPDVLYNALEQWRLKHVGKAAVDKEYNDMLVNQHHEKKVDIPSDRRLKRLALQIKNTKY
jgi:hypothetical protein